MAELRTEEEQITAIKEWWKKNGSSLLIGVGAALAIVFGWQAWQNHKIEQQSLAVSQFQSLLNALENQDGSERADSVAYIAGQLKDNHGKSAYAVYASLILAQQQLVEREDPQAAIETLSWAHGRSSGALGLLTRQRLAQAQFAAGDTDAALVTLRGVSDPGAFAALYAELEGDILKAQGDRDGARRAYSVARESLREDDRNPILDLKLADLAVGEDA